MHVLVRHNNMRCLRGGLLSGMYNSGSEAGKRT